MSATLISYADFDRVELRVGTIIGAEANAKAHKPAYVLSIDLGPCGTKTSSAQVTALYDAASLLGRRVVCVCNLAPRRVAGINSEVLILGAYDENERVALVGVDHPVPNGARLS